MTINRIKIEVNKPVSTNSGISGSPIKNSTTDRLVQTVLEASGLTAEFVKLSRFQVRPCIACLGCKADNICKVKDDFPELAEKVRRAGEKASLPPLLMDGFH